MTVGYAVEGKEIQLLDDSGKEVGFNRIGEIVVRSRYLSSGYWKNPDLTRAKFRPDPDDPAKQIYYTGDLGLRLPDGCLIHKGRKDFRIKIRGYGVDLVEVQAGILSYPGIREAVVIARPEEDGSGRLIAYFTSDQRQVATASKLRKFLKTTLPDYMIPSVFQRLEAIPLTSNGKVDRHALPVPDQTRPDLENRFVEPRTPVEKRLAAIWAEVLQLKRIGVNDNFFDLGGHSLAAARVISRVIQAFRWELPVHAMFDAPTVAEMAAVITAKQGKEADDDDLARMLAEIESISENQAKTLLKKEVP